MKAACLVLSVIILVAIMAVCVMVKFATDITVDERRRDKEPGEIVFPLTKAMGIITINDNSSFAVAERFPYVAAITRNTSTIWSFACFASIILMKWVVTSAHCRKAGSTHRVLIYHDFARNYNHTYPILFWRIHESYNASKPTPKYDIAVSKINVDFYPFSMKTAMFDIQAVRDVEASIWKTVSTMDKKMYLTNDLEIFDARIAKFGKCFETYGVELDDSLICIDMSDYENDCFVHDFGPIFHSDKVVGIVAVQPRDCDVKLAIFTNVSYYTEWILATTHTAHFR